MNQHDFDSYNHFLGNGYGEAVFQIRKARSVEQTLERLGGNQDIAYESYWHGSDDRYDDHSYDAGSRWSRTTLRDVLTELAAYTDWRGKRKVYDFSEVTNLQDLSAIFRDANDHDDGGVGELMTIDEMEKQKIERRRKDLEYTAAEFAAQCGHKVGTREYVLAAYRALEDVRYERERWNDGETRMEQWAACQFAGVGSDVYYSDLNFENGRYANRMDKLRDVLEWLEEVCPLLMRQTEHEQQLVECIWI